MTQLTRALLDMYKTLHPKIAEHTFFSSDNGTLSRTQSMLGHKTSLSRFKRTEFISTIFSNHNSMKLEISYRKKNGKKTKMENKQLAKKKKKKSP